MIGIEFTMRDGTKDSYDPVKFPEEFTETETHYLISMAFDYEIVKEDVVSIRHYELCPECGYELYEDGCRNSWCENFNER
jgi:hypothetical protein